MKPAIYLDYAAATPVDERVLAAMQPYWQDRFYNPSALYLSAKSVAHDLGEARVSVSRQLGARPAEIIFTAGGTEANNLAIQGVMRQFPGANLVVSAIEHESVIEPAGQYTSKMAPVKPDGQIDIEALQALIDDQTVLVSVMYANNEIGTIEPIKIIAQLLDSIRTQRHQKGIDLPLYFHSDACQATNYLDMHVSRLGVDLLTINGSKIYGPKQSGALYVKTGVQLSPQILGGGQERGLRSGTENVAQIIGFAAALQLAQDDRQAESKRLVQLRDQFIKELIAVRPEVIINGSRHHRLPNNVHVTFPGQDNERLLMMLDEEGIQCATGSACTASNDEPSHVLTALGLSDAEARSSLRFTLGRLTTGEDIGKTVHTLISVLKS